jgi:hypothetical protein
MTQEIKPTDEAVDAVDKIVEIGRKICEKKKKEQAESDQSTPQPSGGDNAQDVGEPRTPTEGK